jgi:hypothetical protein
LVLRRSDFKAHGFLHFLSSGFPQSGS